MPFGVLSSAEHWEKIPVPVFDGMSSKGEVLQDSLIAVAN